MMVVLLNYLAKEEVMQWLQKKNVLPNKVVYFALICFGLIYVCKIYHFYGLMDLFSLFFYALMRTLAAARASSVTCSPANIRATSSCLSVDDSSLTLVVVILSCVSFQTL